MKQQLLLFAFLFGSIANAQDRLNINPGIRLPQDSIESLQLVAAINGLVDAAQMPNEQNSYVLPAEKIETFVLLDEINGIEKSGKYKDEHFYKPYLSNVTPINDSNYLVRLDYLGINEGKTMLRGSFELIAHKTGDGYLFSSTLLRNTKNWKKAKINNTVYHYKQSLDQAKATEYEKYVAMFDKKLKIKTGNTDIYYFEDLPELQKLSGISYKTDYNGRRENTFFSTTGDRRLVISAGGDGRYHKFDPHDLWHSRLSMVVSRAEVNKPVDEACAYLYGGSWGISWQEILRQFKAKVASDKTTNWVAVKEKEVNFGPSDREHLIADYVVNALIIQKLEREKGFAAVWELLNCGKYEVGNNNYYTTLARLTGITKENYNEQVWELIERK